MEGAHKTAESNHIFVRGGSVAALQKSVQRCAQSLPRLLYLVNPLRPPGCPRPRSLT